MLLEEVKKLKVTELRAELRERGLDPRGLKAELVARLITALEKGEELKTIDGESQEEDLNEDEVRPHTDKLKNNGNVTAAEADQSPLKQHQARCDENTAGSLQTWTQSRSCVDQSTQTEKSDEAGNVSQTCCCSKRRSGEADRVKTQDIFITDVHDQAALPVSLTPVPSHPDQITNLHEQSRTTVMTETEMERRELCKTIQRPLGERGRDYFEFKEEIQYIRAKTPEPEPVSEDDMDIDDDAVRLDPYNSDLHFEVAADGSSGQPLLWEKFPLLQSGCRLTHGFSHGKVGFEVKFVKQLPATTDDSSCGFVPEPLHVLRVGWSVDGSILQLGEDELSFGYDGVGKVVTAGKMEEYGEPFSEGDVIGCYAFINECGAAELSFSKNGHHLGVAFNLGSSTLGGQALYPHVLCKSCSVSLNLDSQDKEWYPGPLGYCPLPMLPQAQQTRAPLPPPHRKDCEVLMLVGMPGSGKSYWARSHMAKNPDKRYNILSTETVLQCMSRLSPDHNELLLQHATQCLTHLIKIAANRKRNFILDQANIYPSARRHKLLRFSGYQRKAVVVVPSDEEWKKRVQKKEQNDGATVPKLSLLKCKVSFTLPEQGDLLEEVLFVELCHEESQKLLTSYKEEAGRLLPPAPKRKKQQNRPSKLYMDSYGWSQNSSVYAQQTQWGRHKQYAQQLSGFQQSYGCNSDPQQYRDYYQPCMGQWNNYNQNPNYYSNQVYYFGNQAFW